MKLSPALRFLSHQVWAVHPPVFESLAALLESHANGERSAAIAAPAAPAGEPAPTIIGTTAVVPVRGIIARYADQINGACQDAGRSAESLQRDLLTLAADPRVQRIVLRIDSPGGTVAGTSETGDTIRRVSASGKPITAYVDGMAASAAYWLASQCDEIVMAGPTSEVGSIGVITAHVDATRAQESRGFKVSVFRTSPLKAPGAMGETLTREQAAAIDRDLKDFHAVFAGVVQAGRGLTDDQLAAATTGEMWRPATAIAMGLADRVATWDEVIGGSAPVQIPGAHRAGDGLTAAASQPLTPPAAAGTSQEESTMDPKLQAALAALSVAHPTHAAALVAEAMKPGATADGVNAFAAGIVAKAKDEAHAAEVSDLKAKLAAADKAKADAETAKAAAEKQLAALKGHEQPKDPGPGDESKSVRLIPLSKAGSLTAEDYAQIKAGTAAIDATAVDLK